MKLKNSTRWSDTFIRQMSSWCAKQIGMPVRYCKNGVFRKSRSAWGGCARQWRSQITVCIGDSSRFPRSASSHWKDCVFADDVEALVAVTAHELFHLEAGRIGSPNFQSTRGRHGHSSEAVTCKVEREVLETFRQQRQTLLSNWTQQINTETNTESKNDKIEQVNSALTKWKRKLALAKTKVRKLEAKVKRLSVVRPPAVRKLRERKETVRQIAARHGIEIDPHVNRGEFFVYPPPELDRPYLDRFEGDHFAYDLDELRERVMNYVRDLANYKLQRAQNKTCATNERALELTADPNVGSVRRD